MSIPKVAIVILNWNGAGLMKQFLPSVIQFSKNDSTDIIVADNGSTDQSLSLLQEEFPEVKILDLKQNFGFARGYNQALQQIDADYYVILNSDVEVTAGWLDAPIALMAADQSIAAVQPKFLVITRKHSLNMLALPVVLSTGLAIRFAADEFSMRWKKIMASMIQLPIFSGLREPACLFAPSYFTKQAVSMPISGLTWKRLICAGDSKIVGTGSFILLKVPFIMWEAEPFRMTTLANFI